MQATTELSSPGLLRALLDGLSDQIYAIDSMSGRVLDCNDGACRALGYTREELLQLTVPDFDRNVDLAEYQLLIARIIAADREVTLHSTHVRKDGSSFPVEIAARVTTESGQTLSICVVRDITARLKLEGDLREQKRLYESVVRGIPGVVYRYRLGNPSVVLFVDERVRDLLGYEAGEFLRGEVSLREVIVPGDVERVATALRRAVNTGEVVEVRYRARCKDGTERALCDLVQAGPADESGMPLIEAILFDVTETEAREQELEQAFETERERFEQIARAAGLVTYEHDLRTNKITWSGLYEEVLGYPAPIIGGESEWVGRTPPEDVERVRQEVTAAYEEHRMADVEYRFRRGDGEERWLWLRGVPIFNQRGRAVRSVGMVQDVTERKRLEAQVSAAQRMDTVGALAAGISHDVNNFLTTIIGNLDLALMRAGEGDWPELRDARAAAAGCADLVSGLLTFARQREPARVRLSAAEVVEDAVRIIERLAGPEIEVVTDVDERCPEFEADRLQVQQVMMNLALNARDAMPGTGRITLGAEGADRSWGPGRRKRRWVRLWVRDSGPGIPDELHERVFEPYFTTRGVGDGTGLGLSIVHGIARAHGGWAEVGGSTDGAEISVFFPAAR